MMNKEKSVTIGRTLVPGDTIRVKVGDGEVHDRYLEDGPHEQDGVTWVTVADDEGEIHVAEWSTDELGWVKAD